MIIRCFDNFIKITDTIGYFGPQILFLTTFFILYKKIKLLQIYIFGYIINILLNIVLKGVIKEPRPSEDKHIFNIWLNNVMKADRNWYDHFGMPSGHAENVFYSTAFIFFSIKNFYWMLFYLIISLNTIYQRVKYKNHTISQVIVGSIIGSIIGWMFYYLAIRSIKGKMKLKDDDNAPL